jgi:pyruvate/2-oxoglutarate/acetoin dehydrogenase E1 component
MSGREITYLEAINEALHEEMARDPRVFIMGEDVASPLGDAQNGAYGVTTGLVDRFGPERVRNTPISETALIGSALGAALAGCRPIAELMFLDLLPISMDQVANQVAKVRYMFGGKLIVPLVIRCPGGAGIGVAGHHSQSLENLVVHIPGLVVVQPSTPYDVKGLLKTSIRDDNPVFFIEHKAMYYTVKSHVPKEEYLIPLGVADVKRQGSDVTIFATSRQVHNALAAAAQLAEDGIEAEVVDPRTLKPLDVETVANSVRKTHRLVVVCEACKTGSYASEVAATMGEIIFEYLDAPILRVAAEDVTIPANMRLEAEAIPQVKDILAAVYQVMGKPAAA